MDDYLFPLATLKTTQLQEMAGYLAPIHCELLNPYLQLPSLIYHFNWQVAVKLTVTFGVHFYTSSVYQPVIFLLNLFFTTVLAQAFAYSFHVVQLVLDCCLLISIVCLLCSYLFASVNGSLNHTHSYSHYYSQHILYCIYIVEMHL